MPKLVRIGRRAAPLSLALTAWDIWMLLPARHRRLVYRQARVHGPRLVRQAVAARRRTPPA